MFCKKGMLERKEVNEEKEPDRPATQTRELLRLAIWPSLGASFRDLLLELD